MNDMVSLTESAWVDEHHLPTRLSASQLSSVLGHNPYESPWLLYMRKIGKLPWPKTNLAMQMGHTMEPIIDMYYQEQRGVYTLDPGDFTISESPTLKGLFATLDRIDENNRAVELKTGNQYVKKNWNDGPPMGYRIQNQVQMHCAGLTQGAVAAFLGDNFKLAYGIEASKGSMEELMAESGVEYRDFNYEWHEKLCNTILRYAEAFIRRCVDKNPPDPEAQDLEAIRTLHPMDNGKMFDGDMDMVDTFDKLAIYKRDIKRSEEIRDKYMAEILFDIGPNTFINSQGRCMSYKHQSRAGGISISTKDTEAFNYAKKLLTQHSVKFKETKDTTYRVLRNCKMPALEITHD